jgi:hypothetical protein
MVKGDTIAAIGLGSAFAIAGAAAAYALTRPKPTPPSSGSGPAGGGGGGGGGGASGCAGGEPTCSSNADCTCGICQGGCCGTPIPNAVRVLQNNGGSQDEYVAAVGVPVFGPSYCVWSSLNFYPSAVNQFSVTGKLIDASGNPCPCVNLSAQFESGNLEVLSITPTDSNGNFTVTYQLNGPYQGNASCPGPGGTVNTTVVAPLDFILPNGSVIGATVCTIIVYITGV